jgi:hypothetical protein
MALKSVGLRSDIDKTVEMIALQLKEISPYTLRFSITEGLQWPLYNTIGNLRVMIMTNVGILSC